MRSWMLTFSTILLSGVVAAQAPVPGTFNNTPPQTTQQTNGSGNNGGYIVSPPTISYGDGITPTVVTNQDTVNVTTPQNLSLNGNTVQASNPATVNDTSTPLSNNATPNVAYASGGVQNSQGNQQPGAQASSNFDFVKAPNGAYGAVAGSMSDDSVSLGEVARKYRNGRQIAKRTITNADVNALNAQYPGGNSGESQQPNDTNSNGMAGTSVAAPSSQSSNAAGASIHGMNSPQSNGGTAGAVSEPQGSQTPAYAQPTTQSPFAPRRIPDGTKPNAQQGQGIAPRRSSNGPSATPSRGDEQGSPSDSGNTQKQQLPRSSSALPLLGTLGALSTLAGICYFKMR